MPTDTLQHFGSIKLAANQTVSVKAMLKDDKAPEIHTATKRPGRATAVYLQRGLHERRSTCTLGKNWIP